jgi:hypothetical protein
MRWQLEQHSLDADPTLAQLGFRQLRRLPDAVAYAERNGLKLWDLLAYSANANTSDGLLRLMAIFPGHPSIEPPVMLCLDGPRESKHRNPPFEDGVFGKSAELCLYYRKDPGERRWRPENGLLGLFDIGRVHLANEHEWRRTGKWPAEDAPHGETPPVDADPRLALEPISPRTSILDYRAQPALSPPERRAA